MKQVRWAVLAALIGTAFLAGCREDEQGRILSFEPGVYQGKKDAPLSAEALERLRERGRAQLTGDQFGVPAPVSAGGGSAGGEPSGGESAGAAEAPPSGTGDARGSGLGQRLQRQNF